MARKCAAFATRQAFFGLFGPLFDRICVSLYSDGTKSLQLYASPVRRHYYPSMYLRFTTAKEYYSSFPESLTVFGSQAFVSLNAGRASALAFAIGYDDKDAPRLGIVLGMKDGEWHCPFSAPFGEIAYRKPQSLEHIYDFLVELVRRLAPAPLNLTLPPEIYDRTMGAKIAGVVANLAPQRLRIVVVILHAQDRKSVV